MNYRHAYHAGNFADVVKHVLLTRIIEYLKRKPGAFRVIDTHAGSGLYDLSSEEAQKTGEWRNGIGRLLDAKLPDDVTALAAPYLDAVRAFNAGHPFRYYPGSPVLTKQLLRGADRLTAIELHPEDCFALRTRFAGDWQVRVIELDGWLAMGSQVPPKEKRGLVIVDPPFEKEGEFKRIVDGLQKAHRRWPGGTYALWYPIKDHNAVTAMREMLKQTGIPKIMDVVFELRQPSAEPRFDGTGMIVVNPPYVLEDELKVLLPALREVFAEDRSALAETVWVTPA
ncbi:MAG: 23S rRNA (adenine(2030)-N(6))-methyltransferase RlmJ [Neoaquamicrobium sediminum]|uniref:23S rRNA (adenine(2030)-N(6))-methyltransferase RlmJ n=1 Tax=Neoaquamicrobium sediminum TaxID=1849104 RepID=UPI0040358F79